MAVGFAIGNGGSQYNGRITSYLVLSCLVAAMGAFIFGYDIGVSGGVTSMEPFLEKFFRRIYKRMKEDTKISNYCKFDSQLLTLFTSSLYLAGLIASFFASLVTDALGRKPSMLAGGVSFLVGASLNGAASNIYMLIIGRVLLGIGVGFTNQAVPLYLSEMSLPKYRGAISNGFQFALGIGFLSANLINYGTQKIRGGWGWRISLVAVAIPASILTLGSLFLPDTPNSFIQRTHDHQKATRILQRIRGTTDVQTELDDLIKASHVSKSIKTPFTYILTRNYRPQLVMAVAMPLFQILTGINVIGFYSPILFRTLGLGESASLLSTLLTSVMGSTTTLVAILVVDRVGRRFLFIIGGAIMFACQMGVGVIMAAKLGDHKELSKIDAYLVLALVCSYVAGFGVSWGPLGWLIPSEIFPMEIRSAGQSITVAVNFLCTFVVGQTFLAMLCHFKAGIFFFFGGWVALMTLFVYLLLPETKNIPIEQMDTIWRDHWFWSKIVGVDNKE
ncbi:Major facilitator superfamily protein [Perilla frutescens var. hirtella]|uniref:Major facilitator superfamily protein n=1 Tax=Perilla frutescens var. hirtella TaxID=608512 RepID=A0AAD4J510_PERFH|nr:Major facilitator superfamily protein [Perilla frutescens var. hirtella]